MDLVMDRVKQSIGIAVVIVTLLWLQAEPSLFSSQNVFQWRSAFVQYSGILALMMFSVAMVLALRLPTIERWTQGIDKGYRIHKWLGIAGLSLGVFHWFTYHLPKWLISLELLEKPVRFDGSGPHGQLSEWGVWLKQAKPVAMAMGEWGFYLLIALVVVSLWSAVKYKSFRLSHQLMPVAYLFIAVHAFILLKKAYLGTPIYWVTLLFLSLGSLAALYSLFGLIGKKVRYAAQVTRIHYCPNSQTLDLIVAVENRWKGHKAGQFVYLRFAGEEPHPFTIASAAQGNQLRFLIKELGDFTTGLRDRIRVGEQLEIEGPYGQFDFSANKAQIWIGGGVGIAPFMAGLEALAAIEHSRRVHLFFCCQKVDPQMCEELKRKAHAAHASLTIIDASVAPLLTAEDIAKQCGDLRDYDFYFCGPVAFSHALKQALKPYRVDIHQRFHEEWFVMR
ncbi:TPA: ferric reductase [Vibrio vulnificus]|nr:ferric reductase [Vibrio vulnificus]